VSLRGRSFATDEAIQSYRLPRRLLAPRNDDKYYQLLFFIPGISPLFANSLKHILQSPNARIKPCLLPHLKHLLIFLEGYFGFIFAFASCDVFAIFFI